MLQAAECCQWTQREQVERCVSVVYCTCDYAYITVELLVYGVGFHHAGVETGDRKAVESLFVSGELPVLCKETMIACLACYHCIPLLHSLNKHTSHGSKFVHSYFSPHSLRSIFQLT